MKYYNYGIKAELIWTSHIFMGIFFVILGYQLLNNKKINQILSIILINLGVIAILYHSHIWFNHTNKLNT